MMVTLGTVDVLNTISSRPWGLNLIIWIMFEFLFCCLILWISDLIVFSAAWANSLEYAHTWIENNLMCMYVVYICLCMCVWVYGRRCMCIFMCLILVEQIESYLVKIFVSLFCQSDTTSYLEKVNFNWENTPHQIVLWVSLCDIFMI